MPRRGVIYTVAPSYKDVNTIWCGTDDGLIHLTKDGGKTWKNVTPPAITSWSKISIMDAGHFDVNTAYAAVNRIRLDDMHPHIYKTKDGGKTWKEIINGLPNDPINVVREDPLQKGLLFAGSETAVYVSFDDGEHWQPLRLNMPATSIRDLVIKDDDLIIGTHGRSFWILDNIASLRQLPFINDGLDNRSITSMPLLYKPATTYRVRWNMNTDTPLPQEEPAGENPPDGAMIDYYLNTDAKDISLDIISEQGAAGSRRASRIAHFNNHDTLYKIPPNNVPSYWIRPQQILSGKAGAHRFVWDLHYQPLNVLPSYPIAATYMNTAPNPTSPWVMPGNYIVELVIDGKSYRQNITIKMDPRVKTALKDIQLQHDLAMEAYEARKQIMDVMSEIQNKRKMLQMMIGKDRTNATTYLLLDDSLSKLQSTTRGLGNLSFTQLNAVYASLHDQLQDSDWPPTTQIVAAMKEAATDFKKLMTKWNEMKKQVNFE